MHLPLSTQYWAEREGGAFRDANKQIEWIIQYFSTDESVQFQPELFHHGGRNGGDAFTDDGTAGEQRVIRLLIIVQMLDH